MNTKGVEDGMSDEQAVKQVIPMAHWSHHGMSGMTRIVDEDGTFLGWNWIDARSKLPKAKPRSATPAELTAQPAVPVEERTEMWTCDTCMTCNPKHCKCAPIPEERTAEMEQLMSTGDAAETMTVEFLASDSPQINTFTKTFIAKHSLSPKFEPVADGGGLPPLDDIAKQEIYEAKDSAFRTDDLYSELDKVRAVLHCRERQLASSQEALRVAREENELLKRENIELTNGGSLWRNRAISAETSLSGMDRLESPIEVALRERMQQAVATLNLLCAADRSTSIVSHAIRLLSPEGSSR